MNGMINVNKEKGYTSHDVVAKLRGILKQKKIGHTGTLDPDASGVLPVCLGTATKLCDLLTEKEKEYEAVLLLGIVTDTQDVTGTVLQEMPVTSTEEEVRKAISGFLGEQEQIPPMYSAIKVNGKKLYELARAGKTVERQARKIKVEDIKIQWMDLPRICFRVTCSKGTYIRTLCHDIGQSLECGGTMESLIRTRSGNFLLEEALTLGQIENSRDDGTLSEHIISVESFYQHLPKVSVRPEFNRLIENGNALLKCQLDGDYVPAEELQVRVYNDSGRFFGVYRYCGREERFVPVKMFIQE